MVLQNSGDVTKGIEAVEKAVEKDIWPPRGVGTSPAPAEYLFLEVHKTHSAIASLVFCTSKKNFIWFGFQEFTFFATTSISFFERCPKPTSLSLRWIYVPLKIILFGSGYLKGPFDTTPKVFKGRLETEFAIAYPDSSLPLKN